MSLMLSAAERRERHAWAQYGGAINQNHALQNQIAALQAQLAAQNP